VAYQSASKEYNWNPPSKGYTRSFNSKSIRVRKLTV
jgi:hypothetical protein